MSHLEEDKPSNSGSKDDEEIVISGISGRYPKCDNFDEFKQNLLEGIDLVTNNEFQKSTGMHGFPSRNGKVTNLNRFDAQFFDINERSAHKTDPMIRILLEATFEALLDAGINPDEVRGSNTGVFLAVSESDSARFWASDMETIDGYGALGTCRSMFPNRISFAFDFKGPSYSIDCACSSSTVALMRGVDAIKSGECDAVIVGGCSLCLQPRMFLELCHLKLLNEEGICKSFDASANGYVRSDAVGVTYIQRASKARRIYATIVGGKVNNDGHKNKGITFPSRKCQSQLYERIYNDLGINPNEVVYVEAHAGGTINGDAEEANSISDIFCKNRTKPLLIGSVKSNMGHSELAAGFCGLSKILIAMESGIIPSNLHYNAPNPQIAALFDGRLPVVAKNEPWDGGLIALNSIGLGGVNAHVLLRSHSKQKVNHPPERIPRLVAISGRTEDAVTHLIQKIDLHKDDREFLALIDTVFSSNIKGHNYRGYSILSNDSCSEAVQVSTDKRPVWFIYSGMDSQWNLMGKQLMNVDAFKTSIDSSTRILSRYGVDLESILSDTNQSTLENIVNSFVSIAAVQIALTDVLTSVGILPDGIVGHYFGEIASGYADETLTAEQTLLLAYYRGRAIIDSNLDPGSMAAVGLTWEECKARCPPEITPVCHNNSDRVTILGPAKQLAQFIEQLQSEDIFTGIVNSFGCAFNSKFIADVEQKLLTCLNASIPHPKPRTSKWISSSIPEARWNEPIAQLSSAAYFVNNLLSPVLFYEAIQHIPKNAIVVEISPHGVLQPILKRAVGSSVCNVSLMERNHPDNMEFFLCNIGRIYNAGSQPKVGRLYNPITFPVGRGTPSISSLIKWDHSTEWAVADFARHESSCGQHNVNLDLCNEDYQYLKGHSIDGSLVFPFTGFLYLAWKTFAKINNKDFEDMPVVIEELQVNKIIYMSKDSPVKFSINMFQRSGRFEISESGCLVATGKIFADNVDYDMQKLEIPIKDDYFLKLTSSDVYKELRLRGCEYTGEFLGIIESDNHGRVGKLTWRNNWLTFLESMVQFSILGLKRQLYLPSKFKRVTINPVLHRKLAENGRLPVQICNKSCVVQSGGIEISGLEANITPRCLNQTSTLQSYIFSPLHNTVRLPDEAQSRRETLTLVLQLIAENSENVSNLKIVEVSSQDYLTPTIKAILAEEPYVMANYTIINSGERDLEELKDADINFVRKSTTGAFEQNAHLVVLSGAAQNINLLRNAIGSLVQGGFLLLEEGIVDFDDKIIRTLGMEIISRQTAVATGKTYLVLREPIFPAPNNTVIKITTNSFKWVEPIKQAMRKSEQDRSKIYLVANEEISGVVGLTNCLKLEPGGNNIRAYQLQSTSESFNLSSPFYTNQLKKDLLHNILSHDSHWGTYRCLALNTNTTKPLQVEHAHVCSLNHRDISCFNWVERPRSYLQYQDKSKRLCSVYYAALNFRDLLSATGSLPSNGDIVLGYEFSGRDCNEKRVMGITKSGTLATTCFSHPEFLWEVPDVWSLEEAATVPAVYTISYYILIIRGKLVSGNSIFIEDGCSNIGKACISVSLHMGCNVFTTVNNPEKQEVLKKTFPQLNDSSIGNSIHDMALLIMNKTDQRGVDVIVHDKHLPEMLHCLTLGGRILGIGTVSQSFDVFAKRMVKGDLLEDLFDCTTSQKSEVLRLLNDGIASGAVKPFPTLVFNVDNIKEAFDSLPADNGRKVLIKVRDEYFSTQNKVMAIKETLINPEKTYVLVGGLGGFGLELSNWLVVKGVRKLILSSRTGIKTGYQSLCVRRWREQGVHVIISVNDSTTLENAELLLNEANEMGTIGGIFNLALVLRDALMDNQTEDSFKTVAESKVMTTKNLDAISNTLAPYLDYFVVFSSMTGSQGNVGQANYGFTNSVQERICESRRRNGLPGLAIQWGPIGDVGILTETQGYGTIKIGSTESQSISSCLASFEILLQQQQQHAVVSDFIPAEKSKTSENSHNSTLTSIFAKMSGLKSTDDVSKTTTLANLGLDSFMGWEFKQMLKKDYGLTVNAQEVRGLTLSNLNEMATNNLSAPNNC